MKKGCHGLLAGQLSDFVLFIRSLVADPDGGSERAVHFTLAQPYDKNNLCFYTRCPSGVKTWLGIVTAMHWFLHPSDKLKFPVSLATMQPI